MGKGGRLQNASQICSFWNECESLNHVLIHCQLSLGMCDSNNYCRSICRCSYFCFSQISTYIVRLTNKREGERDIEDKRESSPLPLDYKYRST